MNTSDNSFLIKFKINTNNLELTFQDGEEELYEKLLSKSTFYRFCQSHNLIMKTFDIKTAFLLWNMQFV